MLLRAVLRGALCVPAEDLTCRTTTSRGTVGSSPKQPAQVSTGRVRAPELVPVQENIRSAAAQWRLGGCKGDFSGFWLHGFAAFDLCLLTRIAEWPQTRAPGVCLCEAS